MKLDWARDPHRRRNPLAGEWVLVSPQRSARPWSGSTEKAATPAGLEYDPYCCLCPQNERAGGVRNPDYKSVFVFDNDFPALLPGTREACHDAGGLLVARTERGICRVGCFSPRHDLTISTMSPEALLETIGMWVDQYQLLGDLPFVNHVEIFENHGAMMGASNPHPHCQIWANATIPDLPMKETLSQTDYERAHSSCLLCDYLALERSGERMVCENETFAVVVPFWAVWPYETMILSKRHLTAVDELADHEKAGLADILHAVASRYDRLFEAPFPYSMGFHQRPTDGGKHNAWHMHLHFFPPLLRSATVRKFMVGYEMLAWPQRDTSPEMAAATLKRVDFNV